MWRRRHICCPDIFVGWRKREMSYLVGAIIGALLALIVLWGQSAHSAQPPYYLSHQELKGGFIGSFMRDFRLTQQEGRRIIISGRCESSCTLGLKFSNVCVTSGSTLCFHAAKGNNYDPWSNERNELGTRVLGSAVPPELRSRLLPLTNQFKCIDARDLPQRYLCH